MSAQNFDQRADDFGAAMARCANWKHHFFGAAYSTRLAGAISYAESTIRDAKRLLREDGVDLQVYNLKDAPMPESEYMRQREEWLAKHPEWNPDDELPWPPPYDVPSPLAEPD